MESTRRTASITGVLFVVTFVASIPALLLYGPVLNEPDYIIGVGPDTRVFWGAFLEIITAIANIGTAVTLFPILRYQNEGVAIGYVASRVVESTLIALGIISLLVIVTLRQDFAAAPGESAQLLLASKSLVAVHDWTFLLGPGLLAGLGNGLLLGYLMFKSGLVPRAMAVLGLVGGPLVFASGIAVLFGLHEQLSLSSFIATVPEIAWEASLGIYLIVKGFRPSPLTSRMAAGTSRAISAA